jgi:ribosomal protein S18 acetylase RimI-like enzyme
LKKIDKKNEINIDKMQETHHITRIRTWRDVFVLLLKYDSRFIPSISERKHDLLGYAYKLYKYAHVYTVTEDNNQVGFIAFYANDMVTKTAYIAQIAVDSEKCHRGLGTALVEKCIKISKLKGMLEIALEVNKENRRAIEFYKKIGFVYKGQASQYSEYMTLKLK